MAVPKASWDKPMDMSAVKNHSSANLQYVSDMLLQLKVVAGEEGGPFLAYLLDMARSEAVARLQRQEPYVSKETLPSE